MHWFLAAPHCCTQKRITQQHRFFWTLLGVLHFRNFFLPPYFCLGQFNIFPRPSFYTQVLKKVFRGLLSNHYIQWISFTNKPRNQPPIYVFWNLSGVRKWPNSISGSDKTTIFIYNVPFTLHPLIRLMQNITNTQELNKWPSYCFQKRATKIVWLLSKPRKKK